MGHDLAKTKILVVDIKSELRGMREALRDAGFNAVTDETNGLKVFSDIKKNPPQVILVNYNLPQYSGIQIFKSMQADKTLASVKFLMLIPKMSKKEIADLEKQGVKFWVQRPCTSEDLREKIFSMFGIGSEDLKMTADQVRNEGIVLFKKNDLENAVRKFRESNQIYVTPESLFMEGRCYFELKQYDQALKAFQNTMKANKKYPKISRWLGRALQKKKEFKAAIPHLEMASKEDAANAEDHLELGKGYLGDKKVGQADLSFNKAKDMEPENVNNITSIGNAYLEEGLYEKAENTFGEAIDINPENLTLYNRMAMALRKQSKYKDAIGLYMKALKIEPKDEGLYYNLGRALFDSGDKGKAIKALEKAISLDPDFPEAVALKKEYENS